MSYPCSVSPLQSLHLLPVREALSSITCEHRGLAERDGVKPGKHPSHVAACLPASLVELRGLRSGRDGESHVVKSTQFTDMQTGALESEESCPKWQSQN